MSFYIQDIPELQALLHKFLICFIPDLEHLKIKADEVDQTLFKKLGLNISVLKQDRIVLFLS